MFEASGADRATSMAESAVLLGGALTLNWVTPSSAGVFAKLNFLPGLLPAVARATTENVPATPLAVKVGAVAWPEASTLTVTELLPPKLVRNAPLGPLAGAVKVTPNPCTRLPAALRTS